MIQEEVDWRQSLEDAVSAQWLIWDMSDVLSTTNRLATIWLWVWGFAAEIMAMSPHPFSWFWGSISVVLLTIGVAGMKLLNGRHHEG